MLQDDRPGAERADQIEHRHHSSRSYSLTFWHGGNLGNRVDVTSLAESLNESYPAVSESVRLARGAVGAFAADAGASGEKLDAVRLAVSEALTNAVMHAYGGDPGRVEVTAAVASGELWVLIGDDGRGLRAVGGSRGRGIGLALIALVSDNLTIARRSSGGIELRVGFKLAAAERAPAELGAAATGRRQAAPPRLSRADAQV